MYECDYKLLKERQFVTYCSDKTMCLWWFCYNNVPSASVDNKLSAFALVTKLVVVVTVVAVLLVVLVIIH